MVNHILKKVYLRVNRNKLDQQGINFIKNKVNLIYWKRQINLGDALAPVIFEWMLEKKNLQQRVMQKNFCISNDRIYCGPRQI